MRKLSELEMNDYKGSGFLSNAQCMILGGLTLVSAAGQVWGAAAGIAATATVGGCFEEW